MQCTYNIDGGSWRINIARYFSETPPRQHARFLSCVTRGFLSISSNVAGADMEKSFNEGFRHRTFWGRDKADRGVWGVFEILLC